MSNSLSAHSLVKSYRKRKVSNAISLSVSRGEVVGLLGPNGAGKTTCFYMMVGLISPDSGSIEVNGTNITHLPMHQRARLGLGYLPQEASVFRKLTARENILAILETREGLDNAQRHQRADELLQELHITHIADSLGMSLSGGERRRVEIARAWASDPQFILLDEPFAGVDPISVADIKQIIQHLQEKQIGVLITDHNVRDTLSICDRAYIVSEGTIIAEGTPAEIVHHPKVRKVYLGEDFQL